MDILGIDGKPLSKMVEVNGFEFDITAMQENPLLMIIATICIDPTPLQAELLEKAEITFLDAKNRQIFPKVVVEEDSAS